MGVLADLTAKVGELTVKAADKLENNWKVAAFAGAAYVVWNGLIKFETMRFCSQCIIPENCGINLVRTIRPQKLEKESVMIIAQQKCGSTLLCYIASLINVNNNINVFRNDFDLLPMLSFPTSIFPQNFNARQEGKYQMYKLNGRLSVVENYLQNQYKVVWLVRDIKGYSTSVYRWVTNFYPKLMPRIFWYFKLMPWSLWSSIFFGVVAKDHINDCLYVYRRLREGKNDFVYLTTYTELVKNKEVEVKKFATSLGIELTGAQLKGICQKTSKRSMAEYDRFDPVHFGDGGGIPKVNIQTWDYGPTEKQMAWYDAHFKKKFHGTGIETFDQFSKWLLENRP